MVVRPVPSASSRFSRGDGYGLCAYHSRRMERDFSYTINLFIIICLFVLFFSFLSLIPCFGVCFFYCSFFKLIKIKLKLIKTKKKRLNGFEVNKLMEFDKIHTNCCSTIRSIHLSDWFWLTELIKSVMKLLKLIESNYLKAVWRFFTIPNRVR